jgi:hypothetical protein
LGTSGYTITLLFFVTDAETNFAAASLNKKYVL